MYIVGHSPIKSKDLEMGKKIKNLKKRKKKIFEDFTLFAVPKGKICLLQHNLTLFKPINFLFYCIEGKIIINFVTQHNASQVRKSKAGVGGIKSKAAQSYTPLNFI